MSSISSSTRELCFQKTMSALLIILSSVIASCLAAPSSPAACVPDQPKFYWKTPCDGQSFNDRLTVSQFQARQGGKSVDDQGGFDISIPIDMHALINDQYGTVATPLIDVGLMQYSKGLFGKCKWKKVALLVNIDGCPYMNNCHLTGSPTTLDGSINVKALAGPLYTFFSTGTYYGFSLTFKDGKNNPYLCVYVQDVVIKT